MMMNSNQTQKNLMEPPRLFPAKNSHHNPKPTHNEKIKAINLRMFLCGLNEKKKVKCTKHSKLNNFLPH